MAMKIKELCEECVKHVNIICMNERDISVLQSTLEALNEGQRTLGVLRENVIEKAGIINIKKYNQK
jgi:hypothetical protein